MKRGPKLAGFAGTWHLTRRIQDRRHGQTGVLHGTAEFRADGCGLAYSEVGKLHFDNGPILSAAQRYLWQPDLDGIKVRFVDGRPFHVIGPGQKATVEHDCAPDHYSGCYDFEAWPVWRLIWHVEGPRKSYRSASTYRRGG
ncbi:MAG: DUF6314 family protein [Pseudomonadota bacterium]